MSWTGVHVAPPPPFPRPPPPPRPPFPSPLGAAEAEVAIEWTRVLGILAVGATLVIGHLLERNHIHILPEAAVGVLVGALCAAATTYLHDDAMLDGERFNFYVFTDYLLPPIIFEAGYNMEVRPFFTNLGPTCFFAFVGTFCSAAAVGGIVFGAGQLGLCYPLSGLASLTFGSLISATDPVTVLAVFKSLGVQPDLFAMVFGESVLNDAVAIVLSATLLHFNQPGVELSGASVAHAGFMFCSIFVGSMVIGLVGGLCASFAFGHLQLHRRPRHEHDAAVLTEAALSFVFPWVAYYAAAALELSGIVAILFCGLFMAEHTRRGFSPEAAALTSQAFAAIAKVAECYVFIYLGMAWFTFPVFQSTVWLLALVALIACLVGRLHVYVGSLLTNRLFRGEAGSAQPPISRGTMFVMWFSGLRGGVAFALAAVSYGNTDFPQRCGGIPDFPAEYCGDHNMTDSLAILQATLLVTAFTIFVFGGLSTDVAVRCGVTRASQPQPEADGVEMQAEMQPREKRSRERRTSLVASAAEGWLWPGGWAEAWGFGPVGASMCMDTLSPGGGTGAHGAEDEGEDEGEAGGEGPDEGQRRNNSGRLPLQHLTGGGQARKPPGTARRSCSLPRWLAAAIAVLGIFALGAASGRPAICAPELALPSHADHLARVQRENGPTPADSHQAPHDHERHHEKKSNGENATQHHPHEAHGKVADGKVAAGGPSAVTR